MVIDRIWAMPNKNTFLIKPIKEMLIDEMRYGTWLDPFSNNNTIKRILPKIKVITNDLNPRYNADYNLDAIKFFKLFDNQSVDGVVYDPPYSPRQSMECYEGFGVDITQDQTRMDFWSKHKDEIKRIVKMGGKAICFGWNSMGCGKVRGFEMNKVLLIPHGGNKNDTICTIETKQYEQKRLEV